MSTCPLNTNAASCQAQRFLPAHHKDVEMKNKTTAAVLAFLLGGFAADQFYLNERPKRL